MSRFAQVSLIVLTILLIHLQVFEGVYSNARMLHFLTAVVVRLLAVFFLRKIR